MVVQRGTSDVDDSELRGEKPRGGSGLSSWERAGAVALSAVLLIGGIAVLGRALWRVVTTVLATCELPVELPTGYEVPGIDEQNIAVSGGFSQGSFVLCNVDDAARSQLAISQVLDAGIVSALLLTVAVLAFRLVLNRSFYRSLVWCSTACGLLIVVLAFTSRTLHQTSLTTIATQLHDAGITSVYPDGVDVSVAWPAVGAGAGLLLLALLAALAYRNARELEAVI